jgi:hypothetical protein
VAAIVPNLDRGVGDPNASKNYFAMTFKRGKEIEPENKGKMLDMVNEIRSVVTRLQCKRCSIPSCGCGHDPEDEPGHSGSVHISLTI